MKSCFVPSDAGLDAYAEGRVILALRTVATFFPVKPFRLRHFPDHKSEVRHDLLSELLYMAPHLMQDFR